MLRAIIFDLDQAIRQHLSPFPGVVEFDTDIGACAIDAPVTSMSAPPDTFPQLGGD